ncbi:MAG TPA: DUF5615 family PIN-like protein [Pyrinomonadaceae bacterium]|nr:DUF5615 family PIN-like protein [Pyrinomonadaceae bacterium]
MKIKLQADADLNDWIVAAVRRRAPGLDFQTARDAGLEGLHDIQVLGIAAREGRTLVTHDRRTMPEHFAEFIKTDVSPGVIIVSQRLPVTTVAEELILICSTSEAEEWTNLICSIPL